MLQIDIAAVRAGKTTLAEQTKMLTQEDLHAAATALCETLQTLVADIADQAVTFVPNDPAAQEGDEKGWTLGHVIVHLTATLEESFAFAAQLARGIELEGSVRLRYETPWESIQTGKQVKARLAECQRITLAFLSAWPDQPNLDVSVARIPAFGPMNAVAMCTLGLVHGQVHLPQISEILRQSGQ